MSEMKPIAVLRREIGENTWFDWYPVAPGSKTHQSLKDDAGMDYCEVYARPALTDEQVREIAAAAELINDIADWERRNGTAGHLVDDEERRSLSELVSAWAVNNESRKIGPSLSALREALGMGERG